MRYFFRNLSKEYLIVLPDVSSAFSPGIASVLSPGILYESPPGIPCTNPSEIFVVFLAGNLVRGFPSSFSRDFSGVSREILVGMKKSHIFNTAKIIAENFKAL